MDGEKERRRAEPSIRDGEIDGVDESGGQGATVDLERLFAELDGTTSTVATTATRTGPEQSVIAEQEEPPAQPAFDFGESEERPMVASALPGYFSTENSSNGGAPMSRNMLMAGGAVVALSLLLGAVGMFTAFSAANRIGALQQSVDALQGRIATLQVSGDPRVGQLQAEQAGIASRLDEMALRLENQASASPASEAATLEELRKRLEALEQGTGKVKRTATTATKPAAKPATKPTPASGDWTVILVSFATSAQAEAEKGRLQKLGIRAEVSKTVVEGKTRYRLRVPGYTSQEKAKAAIPTIESKSGIKGAWVAHR
ncbi:MAG TPA: SPOR domain-containing protein [Gammaproteobacteria bacterium]